MSKIRKALMAAVAAGGSMLVGELTTAMPHDETGWAGLVGKVLGAAAVAGWAVWRVENAKA